MPSELASIKVLAGQTKSEMAHIERQTKRATMWTVREGGRRVKKEAKRIAPVYGGGAARLRKNQEGPARNPNVPIRGLLRSAIGSSRKLRSEGPDGYSIRVAPRGARVALYSGKIEAQDGYMSKAFHSVQPQMHSIAREAWAKSTRGRR